MILVIIFWIVIAILFIRQQGKMKIMMLILCLC